MLEFAEIVTNRQRRIAIKVSEGPKYTTYIPLVAGKIAAKRVYTTIFNDEWWPSDAPPAYALMQFMLHAEVHGITDDAATLINRHIVR